MSRDRYEYAGSYGALQAVYSKASTTKPLRLRLMSDFSPLLVPRSKLQDNHQLSGPDPNRGHPHSIEGIWQAFAELSKRIIVHHLQFFQFAVDIGVHSPIAHYSVLLLRPIIPSCYSAMTLPLSTAEPTVQPTLYGGNIPKFKPREKQ